jgi:hypothetical protein
MRRWWVLAGVVIAGCSSAAPTGKRPATRAPSSSRAQAAPPTTTTTTALDFGAVASAFALPEVVPSAAFAPPSPREAPPPALPAVEHRAPPYFEKLFETGRAFRYAMVDDVDPHSPEGGRIVTKQEIRCVVGDPTWFEGALASSLVCVPVERRNDDTPEVVRELGFVSAPGGIWITSSKPATQDELAAVIREPPQIAEVPKARTRSFERGGPAPEDTEPCTERVEVGATSACHEERCKPRIGYGDTRARMCFSRGRGLESLREENLMGPRNVTWKLLRVEPIPAYHGEE